ncbi:MAG: ATP-binding cassette protein [Sphingomonadales bacterium]|nr:ATP-binding cassette protein [Sphingomonadales bacterium]
MSDGNNNRGAAEKRGLGIRLAGVTKVYAGRAAIDAIDLDIAAGSFIALVGASGSGKSTLLKTINRLVEPDAGRIEVDGADVMATPTYALRRRIGYVIQGTGLFPHLDVAANIAMGLRIAGSTDNDARVAELLALVDLPADYASRMPDTLSGGQRQRVGFARALATGPGLMLMDEPFGALDPVTRDALGLAYRALHDRLGLTSVMVTHDMAEALLIADRIVVVDRGRIVADAAPADLLRNGGGPVADALIAVPRGQSERLARMMQ